MIRVYIFPSVKAWIAHFHTQEQNRILYLGLSIDSLTALHKQMTLTGNGTVKTKHTDKYKGHNLNTTIDIKHMLQETHAFGAPPV